MSSSTGSSTSRCPRVRDFRGVTDRSFDGNGNYAVGIKEHIIFPEIDYDKIDRVWGMDVVICTTAQNRRRSPCVDRRIQFSVPQGAPRNESVLPK